MTPERARELLGGLATGILTPEERETLFEAALHDQTLFNEVADELEFAAFLQSPETRAQVVNRIPEVEPSRPRWWALRPAWLALSGALAASAVLFVAVWNHQSGLRPQNVPLEVSAPATTPAPVVAPAGVSTPTKPEPAKKETTQSKPKPTSIAGKQKLVDKAEETDVSAAMANDSPAPAPVPAQPRFSSQAGRGGGSSMMPRAAAPAPPPTVAQEAVRQETVQKDKALAVGPQTSPAPGAAAPAGVPMEARNVAVTGTLAAAASLEGTVHDASGAAVPRATIDIVNGVTNATTHTTSDASGRFVVPLPAGGPYTVIAQAPGFRREQQSGITLAANEPKRVDLRLRVGDTANTVEVTASAGLIQQVAVLDFVNSPAQGQAGQQAADLLSRQLLDGGQVRVIDREKVQEAWLSQAQAQSQAGTNRPPNAKQVAAFARTIGADAVIVGTVKGSSEAKRDSARDQADANVAVTAEVIDTKKARSMGRVAVTSASLRGATNQLGIALESQLSPPLLGAVKRVDRDMVTVAFAAPGQPRIGTRLSVYRGKRKIGEVTLTTAYGQSAVGKFSGDGPPRNGDSVTSAR